MTLFLIDQLTGPVLMMPWMIMVFMCYHVLELNDKKNENRLKKND